MENNTWLWRKKSTEKFIASNEVNLSAKEIEEERLLSDKADLEKDLKILNDKLFSALCECNAKDDLVKKHSKMAQEAIAGWEKVEVEAVALKQELDEVLQQRVAGEERLTHLDAALKECMQQLYFVREEQEQRIHDAVMETSREFEKSQKVLEEKLADTSKRLAKVGAENTHLSKALLTKEKLIGDLNKKRTQCEADFNALMTRLDSKEKDNASLKYEVRVLEKELEIRNEEREFNRQTADASHKQHLESVKKIAKLESECQRLRLLVRKRLPGPAALAKMKNEVEMLGKDSVELRRRKLNPSPTSLTVDSPADNFPDTPGKRINYLTEQLCDMAEENKTLKEALNKKANELQFSRIMYARTTSKLSQVESQLEEPSKSQMIVEPRSRFVPHELSLASMSDIESDGKVSCAESWASALISELEHFRNGKDKGSSTLGKTVGALDMKLMDDFVEMEKLAIVSFDKPSESSHIGSSYISSDETNEIVDPLEPKSTGFSSKVMGREIVPVSDSQKSSCVSNQEIQSKDLLMGKAPGSLQDANPCEVVNARESSNNQGSTNPSHLSGSISWKHENKSSVMASSIGVSDVDISSTEKSNHQFHSDLSKSVCKIIDLIEGINLPSLDYHNPETLSTKDGNLLSYKNPETPTGYVVRIFQWKTSELGEVLQEVVQTCYDLLRGKADFNEFAQELTSGLDWIMNHCFSLQDVSSMRDAIKKHYDWDESRSESEVEAGMMGHLSAAEKLLAPRDQLSCLPIAAAANGHNMLFQVEEFQSNVREENKKLKDELMSIESAKTVLEGRLQSAIDRGNTLADQLQESAKSIASLQTELETLKESKGMIEDQIENYKLMNEDLDTQLTGAKLELKEACQKLSSLEVELETKDNCCKELEATCLELQLQLESVKKEEILSNDLNQEGKQLRTDWEITAASAKLAECQETILNLGKQLKALAPPRETVLFDKVISAPTNTITTAATAAAAATSTPIVTKNMNHRSSLLDRILAEDNAEGKYLKSPKTKEIDGNSNSALGSVGAKLCPQKFLLSNGTKHQDHDIAVGLLAIVPSKKQGGGGLWRKLLWGKKKSNSKKTSFPFAP